jgi:hypothetical protein
MRLCNKARLRRKLTLETFTGELAVTPVQTIGCQFAAKSCVVLMQQMLVM